MGTLVLVKRIIAKSDGTTLLKHTGRVYFAAKQILKHTRGQIVRLFKLTSEQEESLDRDYLVSALAHDLGKANSEFILFCDKQIERQNVRHEHISAYVVYNYLKEWLEGSGVNPYVVMSVILGHHLKSPKESTEDYPKFGEMRSDERDCDIYLDSYDINKIIEFIGKVVGTKDYPEFREDVKFERFDSGLIELETEKLDKRYIFALKVLLIWADTLGSAEFHEGNSIRAWVEDNLGPKPNNIGCFIETVREYHGITRTNQTQLSVAKMAKRYNKLAVIANCGSGKTLSELYFAKYFFNNLGYDRIVHITPTKGLVNEVYLKYFMHSGDANIFHSQRIYSLKSMNLDLENVDLGDLLSNLGNQYNATTPDQILSSMIYNRKGMLLLMTLLNSVVVFDEIHAYDKRMLEFFVDFCNNFNIPIIIMSATISPNLLKISNNVGFKIFPNPKNTFADNFHFKRYNFSYKDISYNDLKEILDCKFNIALIVVNVVNRCREIAKLLENDGYNVVCFHSRYRFIDRMNLSKIIESSTFDKPTIIVSTQILEIGIDLNADLFISELAPMSSLIQRLGRVNRKQNTDSVSNCYFYKPTGVLPYSDEDIEYSEQIINKNQGPVSYFDLSSCLEFAPSEELSEIGVLCYSSNPLFTFGKDEKVRNISFPQINCFIQLDVNTVVKMIKEKKQIDSFYVPVPIYDIKKNTKNVPPTFDKFVDKKLSGKLVLREEDYYDKFGYYDGKSVDCFPVIL